MNEILIQNENKPELRFNGQLITETKFEVDLGDQETRKFTLQVYAIDGGGFASLLRYQTSSKSENQICCYEDMDQFKDVENFYYLFEANEVIYGYDRLNRSDQKQVASTCKQIANAYEESLHKFLDLVRSRSNQQKLGDRVVERPAKSSIFRILGLKR